jgi:hypothetical protein
MMSVLPKDHTLIYNHPSKSKKSHLISSGYLVEGKMVSCKGEEGILTNHSIKWKGGVFTSPSMWLNHIWRESGHSGRTHQNGWKLVTYNDEKLDKFRKLYHIKFGNKN